MVDTDLTPQCISLRSVNYKSRAGLYYKPRVRACISYKPRARACIRAIIISLRLGLGSGLFYKPRIRACIRDIL